MKRTLTLHRESLAELTAGELAVVNGGTNTQKVCLQVTQLCPTFGCTGYYPSIFDPCTQ
jgi:hypothetical protein